VLRVDLSDSDIWLVSPVVMVGELNEANSGGSVRMGLAATVGSLTAISVGTHRKPTDQ